MTLDLYGHLFGDRLDEVADALDAAARVSRESSAGILRTQPKLIKLPERSETARGQ